LIFNNRPGDKRVALVTAIGVGFLTISILTGCSAVQISPPIKSCRDYRQVSSFGNFAIQQAKRGAAIQWGAYPSRRYSGTRYIVNVYTGSRRYDAKVQDYPPHGSINSTTTAKYSGKNLQISGKVQKIGKKGYSNVLVYNMVCKIL